MLLGHLLKSVSKKYQNVYVSGICFDSRKVKKNYIFFAIKGNQTSGAKFINDAISRGASAIITHEKRKYKNLKAPLILVEDVRKSLSEACSNFYKKKPSNIIAVTGTNGKSSVANFFYQILKLNKVPVASIGTLGVFSQNYKKKINLTSLDPLSLHKILQILAKKKINNVILEASSHGLDQKRLDNLNIKTGIFTNLSHDHLDYHKNMKSYFCSKMHLFKSLLKKNSKIITDEDNKEFLMLKKIAKKRNLKKITIGSNKGTINILDNKYKKDKQNITISINSKTFNIDVPLIGYYQVKNLLMAVLAALNSGLSEKKIFSQIQKIKPASGRLECVANLPNNSNIIVDFAHTPDALEKSLIALKNQFKKRILVVFGCGGERDKKKRYVMGKIAAKHCHKIFVTDDNPRNENPKEIRRSIIKGCKKKAIEIASRSKAIKTAINELKSNQLLLISGKGHEQTQDYGNKIITFSDKKLIKIITNKAKFYSNKKNFKNNMLMEIFKNNTLKKINYNGVSINTKTIKKNNLFFAIKGKKNDGHKFVKEAINKGAIKSVISKKINKISKKKVIKVKNTLSSLNNLARVTRDYSPAQIIGITGSVGKTTLKNLLSFSLKNYGRVHSSPYSYNNKYGVPLSLSNLKNTTDYGVFEIGMDKKGEIDRLSKLVRPEVGVITNIGGAHFKNFNTLYDIAKAKAEIINNIPNGGNIVLNKDSKFFNFFSTKAKKKGINITSFSYKKGADISLLSIKKNKNYFRLKIKVKEKNFLIDSRYSTKNFIKNILACISIISILSLDLNKLEKKLIDFKIPEGRGDIKIIKKFNKKFKFIDESYNANPLSMISAINNMNHYNRNKKYQKLALLGDMLELGRKSKKFHKELSIALNKSDIDKIFVYGKHIKGTFDNLSVNKKGKVFKNLNEAHNHFGKILRNNDLLMVKGSNATGLNQFSKNIKRRQIGAL